MTYENTLPDLEELADFTGQLPTAELERRLESEDSSPEAQRLMYL